MDWLIDGVGREVWKLMMREDNTFLHLTFGRETRGRGIRLVRLGIVDTRAQGEGRRVNTETGERVR